MERPLTPSSRRQQEQRGRRATVVVLPFLAAVLAGCGDNGTGPDPDTDPPITSFSFLAGFWDVTSVYTPEGGAPEETVAQVRVVSTLGGRALKQEWLGSRGGEPTEMRALYVRSDGHLWKIGGR